VYPINSTTRPSTIDPSLTPTLDASRIRVIDVLSNGIEPPYSSLG